MPRQPRPPSEIPPPDELARITALLAAHEWRFAKTMPQNPHWYSLRWSWEVDQDFIDTVLFIRKYGVREKYGKAYYTVMVIEGFKYWTMGAPICPGPYDRRRDTILINRKPVPVEAVS